MKDIKFPLLLKVFFSPKICEFALDTGRREKLS